MVDARLSCGNRRRPAGGSYRDVRPEPKEPLANTRFNFRCEITISSGKKMVNEKRIGRPPMVGDHRPETGVAETNTCPGR